MHCSQKDPYVLAITLASMWQKYCLEIRQSKAA